MESLFLHQKKSIIKIFKEIINIFRIVFFSNLVIHLVYLRVFTLVNMRHFIFHCIGTKHKSYLLNKMLGAKYNIANSQHHCMVDLELTQVEEPKLCTHRATTPLFTLPQYLAFYPLL